MKQWLDSVTGKVTMYRLVLLSLIGIGMIALVHDGALCSSATNRRAWGDGLHHVIDAMTGLPTRDVIAT